MNPLLKASVSLVETLPKVQHYLTTLEMLLSTGGESELLNQVEFVNVELGRLLELANPVVPEENE